MPATQYRVIGTSPVRKGVPEKATGRAKYAADLSFPNMLCGAILGSAKAHAKIVHIDTARAEALPGVKAVLTAKDTGNTLWGHSPARYDETTLAVDKVRHIGDPVAAVAAVDEQTAKEALDLITVQYEDLPTVMNPLDAMAEGAPVIHERYPDNLTIQVHNHFGDVHEAFANAHYVRTDRFVNSKTDGAALEPQACVALVDLDGRVTLYTSTQVSHYVQRTVAIALNKPVDKIRVIAPNVGGGFGIKSSTGPFEVLACFLALKTGCPVKLILDREQVFYHHRARHQYFHEIKTGVDKTGKILAVEHLAVLDGGAYSSFSIATTYYNGSLLSGPYRIPNMKYDGYCFFTNKPASGAVRGHGGVSNRACFETQLDLIAHELGIDPTEMRLRNCMTSGETTCAGYKVGNFHVGECIQAARESAEWTSKRGHMVPFKGIGAASGFFVSGAGEAVYRTDIPHSTVVTRVADDGNGVTVYTGSNEIGQGSDTVVAMITAEVLGLDIEDITVISGDTGLCPVDLGAYSSRQTLMTGNACLKAAEAVRSQIFEAVSYLFELPVEKLSLKNGKVMGTELQPEDVAELRKKYKYDHRGFQDLPESGPLTFREINRYIYSKLGPVIGKGSFSPSEIQAFKDWKGSVVGASPAYSTQTCIAEVTVDPDTGELTIDKINLAHDCGKAINRLAVEGQMEGSMCHGLSEGLFERLEFTDNGHIINHTLGDYKIATAMDVPDLSTVIIESNEPNGPFGAKEVGEGCIVAIIPAIVNAIFDACGVVIMEHPITAESILNALQAKAASGFDTYVLEPSEFTQQVLDAARVLNERIEAQMETP